MHVKICGIKTIEHALGASEYGADYIGLVFAPGRRQVTTEQANNIVQALKSCGSKSRTVGVFVNTPSGEVNNIAEKCGLDIIQLSGDEPMTYCAEITKPVIKAVRLNSAAPKLIIEGITYLLDTDINGKFGGTGVTGDWKMARQISEKLPVILAGGLTPENVEIAIREIRPWGVDVSSGVETGGTKDMNKIQAFIKAARNADVK